MNDKNTTAAGLVDTDWSDKQLRARVKLLGGLLGNVLLKYAGAKVYDSVEKLRTGFINLRKEDSPKKRARLMSLIESLDPETLTQVVTYIKITLVRVSGKTVPWAN